MSAESNQAESVLRRGVVTVSREVGGRTISVQTPYLRTDFAALAAGQASKSLFEHIAQQHRLPWKTMTQKAAVFLGGDPDAHMGTSRSPRVYRVGDIVDLMELGVWNNQAEFDAYLSWVRNHGRTVKAVGE